MKLRITLPEGARSLQAAEDSDDGWMVLDHEREEFVGDEGGMLIFLSLRLAEQARDTGVFDLGEDDELLDPDTLTPAGARGEVVP